MRHRRTRLLLRHRTPLLRRLRTHQMRLRMRRQHRGRQHRRLTRPAGPGGRRLPLTIRCPLRPQLTGWIEVHSIVVDFTDFNIY